MITTRNVIQYVGYICPRKGIGVNMGLTYALNDNLADVLKAVEGVSPDVVDQLIHVIVVEWLYDNFDLTDEQEETLDHVMGLFR